MKTKKIPFLALAIVSLGTFLFSGCDKSTEPGPTEGQISMTAKYTTSAAALFKVSEGTIASVAKITAVDSIRITRA
jgi:hypothetical protein